MEINHFSHPHPLVILDPKANDDCFGCGEAIDGSCYGCGSCEFFLHKKCVDLPREIKHPLHTQHPLILNEKRGYWCNVCRRGKGFTYYCISCDFDLDIRCATSSQFSIENLQKLHHFSHHHSLIFVQHISIESTFAKCSGCMDSMSFSSPFYCCPGCIFHLHKACAELPLEINHSSHQKHPLTLQAKPPAHQQGCSCYICSESWKGFFYYCFVCKFGLKVPQCFDVLLKKEVMAKIHDHPLWLFFAAKEIDVTEWKGDILVVGVTEKDLVKDGKSRFENSVLNKLDAQLGGLLAEASSEEDFTGKAGQSLVLRINDLSSKRVGLIGLGQSSSTTAFRGFGEGIAAAAKSAQAKSAAAVVLAFEAESKLDSASAIASGIIQGIYEDVRCKSETKKPLLKSVDVLGFGSGAELEKRFQYAEAVSSAIILGKELVNSPTNVLTPATLAGRASNIASQYSDVISAKILTEEQCKELNMGSFLAVAAASVNPPHFIHLCYKPSNGVVKTKLALVGKGLTFDSGGCNIKTGPAGCLIEVMKFDMGGSAAVLGAAKAIGQIKPAGVEVHFIVAACENMTSGTGMRPGDIVTASNGKTIEVNNTDAEGRLTLADALVYACNQGVDKIIDLASLTEACIIALGPSTAGVFTPSDALAKEVIQVSEITGEKFWRMPMEESYWETMKSGVADMVNTGGPQGGAITASLFLKQFVDEKVEWMHIDLAGSVWNDKKKSATGFGISTLVEWVLKNSS